MRIISFVLCFLFSSQAISQTISRDEFISQLSLDNCSKSPENLYIDTSNTQFDLAHAYSLSWVALQTLDVDPNSFDDDPDADLNKAKEQWHLSNVKMIENKPLNVKAMVADYEDVLFLTFRHTDSNLNWLFNADYGLWNFDHSFTFGEKVHHGFGMMLGSIWDETVAEIQSRNQGGSKPVYVFGLSLGGALALLAAPGLSIEGVDVAQVYATGSPKVASRGWTNVASQQLANTPIYRVTNDQDLFARVPVSNYALDEFREMFSFVPDFIADAIGNMRSQMEFGIIGDHALMLSDDSLKNSLPVESELEEQGYWLGIADQFSDIDANAENILDNLNQKYTVISNNLSAHLMRKEEDGYTCSMIKLLKSE